MARRATLEKATAAKFLYRIVHITDEGPSPAAILGAKTAVLRTPLEHSNSFAANAKPESARAVCILSGGAPDRASDIGARKQEGEGVLINALKHAWEAFSIGNSPAATPAGAGVLPYVHRGNRELTDPSTGAVLDAVMDPVGSIRVATVRDKISIATIAEGNPSAGGDVVRLN